MGKIERSPVFSFGKLRRSRSRPHPVLAIQLGPITRRGISALPGLSSHPVSDHTVHVQDNAVQRPLGVNGRRLTGALRWAWELFRTSAFSLPRLLKSSYGRLVAGATTSGPQAAPRCRRIRSRPTGSPALANKSRKREPTGTHSATLRLVRH